jgi:hypothetical protein
VGPTLPQHDILQTLIGELGVKVKVVPVIVAGNGWYGKNSGGVFGNLLQIQLPVVGAAGRDVIGFGAWGQLGFSITKELGLWGFYGIDQPNADEAKAAGFRGLQPWGPTSAAQISHHQLAHLVGQRFAFEVARPKDHRGMGD